MNKPRQVKSFANFNEHLKSQQPKSVAVMPDLSPSRGFYLFSATQAVAGVDDVKHGLLYEVTGHKKNTSYSEHLFTETQSESGSADRVEREKRLVSLLLEAEVRVEYLRTALPDTEVFLALSQQTRLSEDQLQLLHSKALELDINVPMSPLS